MLIQGSRFLRFGGDTEPGARGPEQTADAGSCPSVGRYGNWFRSGDQLIILLEEDQTPLDQGAQAAGGATNGAPSNGGPEAAIPERRAREVLMVQPEIHKRSFQAVVVCHDAG